MTLFLLSLFLMNAVAKKCFSFFLSLSFVQSVLFVFFCLFSFSICSLHSFLFVLSALSNLSLVFPLSLLSAQALLFVSFSCFECSISALRSLLCVQSALFSLLIVPFVRFFLLCLFWFFCSICLFLFRFIWFLHLFISFFSFSIYLHYSIQKIYLFSSLSQATWPPRDWVKLVKRNGSLSTNKSAGADLAYKRKKLLPDVRDDHLWKMSLIQWGNTSLRSTVESWET